jgi:hypothetical protein
MAENTPLDEFVVVGLAGSLDTAERQPRRVLD